MDKIVFIRKIFQQGNSLGVTIPEEIVDVKRLEVGNEMMIALIDGEIRMGKKK